MAVDKVYQEIYETLIRVKGAKEAQKQLEELDKASEKAKKSLVDWNKVTITDMGEHVSGPASKQGTTTDFVDDTGIREASTTIADLSEDYDWFATRIEESAMNVDVLRHIIASIENSMQMIDSSVASTDAEQEQLNTLFVQYSDLLRDAYATLSSAEARMDGLATSAQQVAVSVGEFTKASPFQNVKNTLASLSSTIQGIGTDTAKTVVGSIGYFKRLGLTLLGVRSTYTLFRKAISSAIASNAELGQKFNAIWAGIGNAIAPILERIVNLILRAFAYLNLFVKAVSGGKIDLLANTASSAESTAGSLKEANKYLAGFDELTNVDQQSGGGGSAGGVTDPFADMNTNPVWADRIQAFGEWVKINWPLVIGLLAGTWLALQPCYSAFSSWEKLGIVLVIAGIAEGFKGMYDFINGIKTGNLDLIAQGLKEIAVGIALVSAGFLLLTQGATGGIGLIIASVVLLAGYIIENWDTICADLKKLWENLKASWDAIWEAIKELASAFKDWFIEKWNNIKYAVIECWNSIKNNWDALKQKLSDGVTAVKDWFVSKWENIKYAWGEIIKSLKDNWDGFKNKVKDGVDAIVGFWNGIKQGAKDMANNVIASIEGMINKAVSGINSLIRGLNKIHFSVPDWVPLIGGKYFGFNIGQLNSVTLPRLDTGTNYVPSDQLAMIHKGEAVIPKKFNSQEYFGSNSEMIEKLDTLIEVVNNIDVNPYITVKDVGEASVKYQNQQYRLRGRSLVNG